MTVDSFAQSGGAGDDRLSGRSGTADRGGRARRAVVGRGERWMAVATSGRPGGPPDRLRPTRLLRPERGRRQRRQPAHPGAAALCRSRSSGWSAAATIITAALVFVRGGADRRPTAMSPSASTRHAAGRRARPGGRQAAHGQPVPDPGVRGPSAGLARAAGDRPRPAHRRRHAGLAHAGRPVPRRAVAGRQALDLLPDRARRGRAAAAVGAAGPDGLAAAAAARHGRARRRLGLGLRAGGDAHLGAGPRCRADAARHRRRRATGRRRRASCCSTCRTRWARIWRTSCRPPRTRRRSTRCCAGRPGRPRPAC